MYYYIRYISFLVIVLTAFITGYSNYRKADRKMLPVIILLGYTFVSTSAGYFMAKYLRNNMPVDHVYGVVATCLWGWFYYQCFEDKQIKTISKWSTCLLVVFLIFNTIFLQPILTLPDNGFKMMTLFNLIWGAVLFIQMLDLPAKENIFKNSFFLVALGVVWFNIISSLYFFLSAFLVRNNISSTFINSMHYYSNYVYYIILIFAMLYLRKTHQNVRNVRL